MKKAAILLAPGFEEGEALTIADILRRGAVTCDLAGFSQVVEGAHNITVKCDQVISKEVAAYDMVILPGGYGGAAALRDSDLVISLLQNMYQAGKFVCAMCAAPIALERAGLLDGHRFTAYMGYEEKIRTGTFLQDMVVVDGNLVTSRGPATAYAFAYRLLELLGGDAQAVKDRMVYTHAFAEEEA